ARWIDIEIQSLRFTLPSRPPCFLVASSPDSAMKRNGLVPFRRAVPSATLLASQKVRFAIFAWRRSFVCSYSLVMITYQLPIDMNTRMPSVIFRTMSPPFHIASRPYGLSTISTCLPAGVAAFAAGAVASGAGAAGAGCTAGVAGAGAWARAASGPIARPAAISSVAASADQRVDFHTFMVSPDMDGSMEGVGRCLQVSCAGATEEDRPEAHASGVRRPAIPGAGGES